MIVSYRMYDTIPYLTLFHLSAAAFDKIAAYRKVSNHNVIAGQHCFFSLGLDVAVLTTPPRRSFRSHPRFSRSRLSEIAMLR